MLALGLSGKNRFGWQVVVLLSSAQKGDGIAELAVRQDLGGDRVEPFLEGVQDGDAVVLTKAANAVISRFTLVRLFVSRLAFNPVELLEELERLLRRPAGLVSRLEGIDKTPS